MPRCCDVAHRLLWPSKPSTPDSEWSFFAELSSERLCPCTILTFLVALNNIPVGWFLQVALVLAGTQAQRGSTSVYTVPGVDPLTMLQAWAGHLQAPGNCTSKICSVSSLAAVLELLSSSQHSISWHAIGHLEVLLLRLVSELPGRYLGWGCVHVILYLFLYLTLLWIISAKYNAASAYKKSYILIQQNPVKRDIRNQHLPLYLWARLTLVLFNIERNVRVFSLLPAEL